MTSCLLFCNRIPLLWVSAQFSDQPLSQEGELRAAYLTRKLQHKIISTRVSARELLGDYDPHLNGGTVGWMKKVRASKYFTI
jgi:hypothetical protein